MSDPENFLSRWSRRKRVADEAPEKPTLDEVAAIPSAEPAESGGKAGAAPSNAVPEAVFDPASLPPIDSIDAQTDISAFLKAGVPGDLRLAALRRAWSSDPSIRDFKGLAENDWDFTDPKAMVGFGPLDPGTDVKKILANLFSEPSRTDKPAGEVSMEQVTNPSDELPSPTERVVAAGAPAPGEISDLRSIETADNKNLLQREENIAMQNEKPESDDSQSKRRRAQGSALPQ